MNSSELNQTIYNWKRAKVIFKGKTIFRGNPHEALQKFKELKGSTL